MDQSVLGLCCWWLLNVWYIQKPIECIYVDSIRLSLPEMARKVVSGKGQVCLACATLRKGRGQLPRSCALGLLLR